MVIMVVVVVMAIVMAGGKPGAGVESERKRESDDAVTDGRG
jgi:hypothetical protein